MKKKLLLILVAILVLVVGVFGYLAVNANSIIAKYKPEIEQKISVSLGSKVSLGDLSVSIFPSVKVGVNELTVAEAKAGDKFSLKNITANVGLLDLLSGKVNVKSLSIDKPSITLLKSGDKITIAGLPEKNDGSNTPRASHNGKSTASSAAGTSVSPVNIDLNSLSINSANINIKDANSGKLLNLGTFDISSSIAVESTGINVSNLSVIGSFLDSGKINVSGNINGLGAQASKINLNTKLQNISPEKLSELAKLFGSSSPLAGNTPFSVTTNVTGTSNQNGDIDFNIALNSDSAQLSALSAPLTGINISLLVSGNSKNRALSIQTNKLALKLNDAPVDGELKANTNQDVVDVSTLHLNAFSGTIDNNSELNTQSGSLNTNLKISNLNLESLISAMNPSKAGIFSGTLTSLKLSGNTNTKADVMNLLNGNGEVVVDAAKMVGSNIIGDVLKSLGQLTGQKDNLASQLPADQQASINSNETQIKSLTATYKIANGKISTSDFVLNSNLFSLKASGSAGLDGSVNLDCQMTLVSSISGIITSKVKELSAALDEKGQLNIPVSIRGQVPAIIVTPDLKELLKVGLQGTANRAINDLLSGKKLDGEKGLKGLLGF